MDVKRLLIWLWPVVVLPLACLTSWLGGWFWLLYTGQWTGRWAFLSVVWEDFVAAPSWGWSPVFLGCLAASGCAWIRKPGWFSFLWTVYLAWVLLALPAAVGMIALFRFR